MNSQRGTYALILRLSAPQAIEVGRLGLVAFRPGFYAYVGSALGPGGLAARIEHHVRAESRPHWHIDYLRRAAPIVSIWFVESQERLECIWARALGLLSGYDQPARAFGASDCRCDSHLAYFESEPDLQAFQASLMKVWPGHAAIKSVVL